MLTLFVTGERAMKKLTLNLDELTIDSFDTAPAKGGPRGTVEGRGDCTCGCPRATEAGTCEGDNSCDAMCTHDLSCQQMTECHGNPQLAW